MERPKNPVRRCAIYTRKSSEEGLEQQFNSLHAQREAAKPSSRARQVKDGVWSRQLMTMAVSPAGRWIRPALKRLLADIGQGLIDIVVVYKVERLTRSLADFAKMVEVFDAREESFVAVTQQFNTTTSMGCCAAMRFGAHREQRNQPLVRSRASCSMKAARA